MPGLRQRTLGTLGIAATTALAVGCSSPSPLGTTVQSPGTAPASGSAAPSSAPPAGPATTRAGSGADPGRLTTSDPQTVGQAGPAQVAVLPGSGAASKAGIPRSSPAGRPLAYWDDFTTAGLSSHWGVYDAIPRSSPHGLWRPSQVMVTKGALVLRATPEGGRWVTGGVMNYGAGSRRYGTYLVRFRVARATGIKYAFLLWPSSDHWPVDGEIDFAEDGGGPRRGTTATLHFGADDQKVQRYVSADFTTWRTVGVEWTKGRLDYVLDGKVCATVTGAAVPDTVMNLALQTESVACGEDWGDCPDATTPRTVDLEIDWVAVYATP